MTPNQYQKIMYTLEPKGAGAETPVLECVMESGERYIGRVSMNKSGSADSHLLTITATNGEATYIDVQKIEAIRLAKTMLGGL